MVGFFIFSMTPLEAINLINQVYGILMLLFFFGVLGGLFVSLDAQNGNGIAIGFIMMILGMLCFGGGLYLHSIQNDLQSQRPSVTTPEYSFNTSENLSITSLDDTSEYSMYGYGHFILGSGSISANGKTTEYYTYYKNLGNDEYEWGKLEKDGVTIKEDDNTHPHIEWIYNHAISAKKRFTDNNETEGGSESIINIKKYIHVPKGTVIKELALKP